MKNPYDILGVKEEDSDEVINKAYKKLARQYHPDINPSPEAAEKMVEINCAYDEIKKMREQGIKFSSYNNNSYSGYDSYNYGNSGYNTGDLYSQVEQFIRARRFFEAFIILQSIQNRDARWCYYSSIIMSQMGSLDAAKKYINEAIRLDPNNQEYLKFKEVLDSYQPSYNNYYGNNHRVYYSSGLSLTKILFWVIFLLSISSCIARCFGGQ